MIKKTILPILLVLILVFAMMPMAASAEDAGTGHAGQDGWTEWNDEKKLPNEAGKYYLTKDVTIKASWSVPEGKTTLCLNGKTIKLELPEGKTGRVINIANHDKLTICDHSSGGSGRITGGNADNGAGVNNQGTFTMEGGSISGNTARNYGAGVNNQGTFTMEEGSISGNTANCGGGVENRGTFTMSGGSISDNTANGNPGGGVMNSSTFTMSGGSISGNTANYGAGVENDGAFTMSGGSISGNTAINFGGGVEVLNNGTLNIGSGDNEESRDITISGNKNKKGDGKTDNVYLHSGNMINVTGEVSAASKIGVTTESQPADQAPVVFTSGLSGKGNISNFFSDEGYAVTETEGNSPEAQLTAHKHEWTIWETEVSGTYKIKCTGCTFGECTVTATAEDRDYTGEPYDGVTITAQPALPPELFITWTYEGRDGTDYDASETGPTNAGTYTATAIVNVRANPTIINKQISLDFSINKAQSTVTTEPASAQNLTYNAAEQQLVTAGTASGGRMQYAIGEDDRTAPTSGWSDDIPEKTDSGTYNVWYKAKGDSNHYDSEPGCVKASIAQTKSFVISEPNALSLTYNAAEQQLVTAGTASGGTMQYAIGEDDRTAPTSGWSGDIPEKTDAGTYNVWYKAKGDSNHYDSEPGCVKAGIAQTELTIIAKNMILPYNGKKQGPVNTKYEDPTEIKDVVTVSGLKGSDKLTGITIDGQGKEIGEYDLMPSKAAIGAKGKATGSYDITYVRGTLTIKEAITEVTLSKKSYIYNGQVQKPTVTVKAGDKILAEDTDYTAAWSNAASKAAGPYTVTITGKGNYAGMTKATYKINKAANPLTIKGKTATIKYKKLKKKAKKRRWRSPR